MSCEIWSEMCINSTLGLFVWTIISCLSQKSPGSCSSILVLVTRKEVCDLCSYNTPQEHITYV